MECVIRHLATFHATWWEHPRLVQLDWMPFFHDEADVLQGLYQQLWSGFVEKFSGLLPGAFLEIGARFGPHFAHSRHQLAGPPRTVVHGDLRLDNCLFGPAESDTALTVIDWQVALRGRGVSDVAYFLAFCLPPSQRRALEESCLKLYHTLLGTNGVRGYEFAQCVHDYRLSMLQVLCRLVIAGALLDFTSERGQASVEALIQRCAGPWRTTLLERSYRHSVRHMGTIIPQHVGNTGFRAILWDRGYCQAQDLHMVMLGGGAEPRRPADGLQRPRRTRFAWRLTAGVRRRRQCLLRTGTDVA